MSNKCKCIPDETTGWTSVKCCNICGKPVEDFWASPKTYTGKEVSEMMKASYKAGVSVKNIDLKELQSVLHNVQNVMAGYMNDDTWSDYDRESHDELIKMQYKVEAEINNVQPIEKPLCGVGEKNRN